MGKIRKGGGVNLLKNTYVQVMGNSPINAAIKTIYADVIEPEGDLVIEIEEFKFPISKILTIDYIEPLIDLITYIKVNGLIYKVLKIKTSDDNYMEIYLYLLKKQVI